MPYSSVDKPSSYFNISLWTGNDSTQSLSSFGFSPDLVWIKTRTGVQYHGLFDTIRGALVSLQSNTTTGDQTFSNSLTSFDSDGFTLGLNDNFNWSTKTYVGWSWRGSDSSAVSNTSGSITSTVSANTTSGFSIVSYTGTGSNATVGHGLGVAPSMIIVKNRNTVTNWFVYHSKLTSATYYINLNSSSAQQSASTVWNSTAPTSTVFSLGTADSNTSSSPMIAYCFAEIKGFSKFGSYTGNGSTDGTFVYTGFTPAMIIAKNSSSSVSWTINDNKRNTFNPNEKFLYPNLPDAEGTNLNIDYLSNGFKIRATSTLANTSGETYIYAAFASNPFVSSKGIPVCAR